MLESCKTLEGAPWKLAFSQRLGRHAVATRAIKAGERVFVEAAVATVVREQLRDEVCAYCFRQVDISSGQAHKVAPSSHR